MEAGSGCHPAVVGARVTAALVLGSCNGSSAHALSRRALAVSQPRRGLGMLATIASKTRPEAVPR